MKVKTDIAKLTQIIEDCSALSIDDRLDAEARGKFGDFAERLRPQLVALLSKTFDQGTPELLKANARIQEVNASLKRFTEELAGIADMLERLSKLVSVLDGLLKIPLAFV
jgi:hypothetical protein